MALGENSLSIADAMALSKGNEDGFLGGNGSWIFFLFFLLAWGGGGFFGGGSANAATREGELTRSDLYTGLGQQDAFANQNAIKAELTAFERDAANRWGSIQYELMQGLNGTNNLIAEGRFASQQCCCETNRNIDAIRYENAKNTADIINANAANTQRVMDLMMQNQLQTLRDELATTRAALSNNMQTQTLLSTLQPVPRPAYVTASPYAATNYCGCGV